MKLTDLAHAGRSPTLPLTLALPAGELTVQQWLRVLPGQRYVGKAQWQGRDVLAKLLVGTKAERHFQRERRGARLLAEQGMTTPALLAEGLAEGQGGWLLFDYLAGGESLAQAWHEVKRQPMLSDAQQDVLGAALGAIAQLHTKGLWQSDLHLDNLLRHEGKLHLIDGGAVQAQTPGQPLGRDKVLANLGVFFAQLPASLEPHIEELLVHYLLVNGEHALPLEVLLREVANVRRWRLRDYLSKLGRDCSLFSVKRGLNQLRVVRREDEPLLHELLAAPDMAVEAGHALKLGGSSTVALVEQGGRQLVVKRYNIKGLAHWLRRCWRPSRAWHSWLEGNRLAFFDIATPQPLAILELRWMGLRRRSYLITEYSAGEDIVTHFRPYLSSSPPEAELSALDQLFASLLRERISHGDMKGTNLLWEQGRWSLIDLDAAQQHGSNASFPRAYAKDRARLLRNWPIDSALYRLLDERLPRL
ncbi:lipopolysaccharide kinase InaA family protein [Stutzerimonas xanthomarina]|uniref:Lipopolysaccharide kinase (Kdo/WaaP) family protein n=2 Tax=Stutzerimonas xanthomarina TaxID=271420 RepID=A0A1M5KNT9_9GAMM|nr:lipopolysaccharide kinase InaA family protein [Stutzerimonas xanthomarina]MCP9337217.1 serine/threonine protein kinase [Stutzerimonas xanthomarina]SEI07423.1 Lipopolysaccharide kinase (Kdo/WaaP) family protein [Stutzerimonas xanthomarina]SHG54340.1 Lipopolysaccharide kinase (Kdo/WaaP) family protein [Stutzerimonas xanthomarina DSM 18231]